MADFTKNIKLAHNLDLKGRTADIEVEANINFKGLFLSSPILKGLEDSGFVRPSPIQLEAIPLGRCGLDLIVQAKSGTGKTCVFAVIALEAIASSLSSGRTQVLILAPTREIAVQINDSMIAIGSALAGLQSHFFIGGMPLEEDKKRLKRCHVAVGTPGRIQQLIKENVLKTKSVRLFVIDEADKLLDANFQETINWIYSQLPPVKQMLALSATYKEEQAELLTRYMRNPTFVRLDALRPVLLGLQQFYCNTGEQHCLPMKQFDSKAAYLLQLFSHVSFKQCLVFTNYQMRAQSLCDKLLSKGWPSACIAGNQEQQLRLKTLSQLKKFECRVLITTDLTARGIDVENVDLVINLDVPWDTETYLHRIGRAGRFGSLGIAITLTSSGDEQKRLDKIQAEANLNIKELPVIISSTPSKRESSLPNRKLQDFREGQMKLPSYPAPKVEDMRYTSHLADSEDGDKDTASCRRPTYNSLRSELKMHIGQEISLKCQDVQPVAISLRNFEVIHMQDQCYTVCTEAMESRCRFVSELQKNLNSLEDASNSNQYSILLSALQEYVSLPNLNTSVCEISQLTDQSQEGRSNQPNVKVSEENVNKSEGNVGISTNTTRMRRENVPRYPRIEKDRFENHSFCGMNSHRYDCYSHCHLMKKYYGKWWEKYNEQMSCNRNPNFFMEYLKAMTHKTYGTDIFS